MRWGRRPHDTGKKGESRGSKVGVKDEIRKKMKEREVQRGDRQSKVHTEGEHTIEATTYLIQEAVAIGVPCKPGVFTAAYLIRHTLKCLLKLPS